MTLLALGLDFDFEIHRLTHGRWLVTQGGVGGEQTLRAENHRLGMGYCLSLDSQGQWGREEQAGIG